MSRSLTLLLLTACAAFRAMAGSISVEVRPDTVYAGQPFLLSVTAVGKMVDEPQLPVIEGLQVDPTATQRSDQYSMSTASGMNVVKTRGYAALAQQPGKVVIPPVTITIDGQLVASEQVVIDVRPAQAPAQAQPAPRSNLPQRQQPQANGLPDPAQWVFIRSEVDKKEVYVGESVRLVYELWRIIHRGIETGTYPGAGEVHPTTEGFYATEPQAQRQRRVNNGYEYDVIQYMRMLYPTRPGTLTIGAWQWEGLGRVWGMFNADQHPYNLSTEPIIIEVKPLPPSPQGYSGGVGTYAFSAELSRTDALQGVPVELTVLISGRGNPDAVGEPLFPALPDAYVAEPVAEVAQAQDEAGVAIEKRIRYAISPLKPGPLQIPALVYTYFDPTTGQYESRSAGPFTLQVKASGEGAGTLVTAEGGPAGRVAILNEDIQPIIATPAGLERNGISGWAIGFWLLIPMAGYGVMVAAMSRRRRLAHDIGFARSERARKRATQRLREAPGTVEPAEEVCRALTGYLADKHNVGEAGMTASDAQRLLAEAQAPERARENVLRILQRCERSRYAGAGMTPQESSALAEGAAAAIEELEAFFRKGRR